MLNKTYTYSERTSYKGQWKSKNHRDKLQVRLYPIPLFCDSITSRNIKICMLIILSRSIVLIRFCRQFRLTCSFRAIGTWGFKAISPADRFFYIASYEGFGLVSYPNGLDRSMAVQTSQKEIIKCFKLFHPLIVTGPQHPKGRVIYHYRTPQQYNSENCG